jgi:hypothetical protein
MATNLIISSTISGGRTTYEPITSNGIYQVALDNTKNYIFTFTKLFDTSVVIVEKTTNANGTSQSHNLTNIVTQALIDKRDFLEIQVDNIFGEVKIESYIK